MNRRSALIKIEDLEVEKAALSLHITVLIENAMIEQGVSRAELARRMGVVGPHVTQLLSGERNLTLATVTEMLYHLGLRLDARAVELVPDHLDRAGWESAPALRRHLVEVHGRGTTRPSWERMLRYHAEAHQWAG